MNTKIALIQTHAYREPLKNIEHQLSLIDKAAEVSPNIVCLQELCTTEYFCRTSEESNFELAVGVAGEELARFGEKAKEHSIVLIVPYFEKRAPGIFHNSAVIFDTNGDLLTNYRKMHIPDDPGFSEKYYFTEGDQGYVVVETKYGKIGILICWDQWFPEAARLTALQGANILFYPTAIGTLDFEGEDLKKEFLDAWQIIQRSHAIANGCFVASVNRVGEEYGTTFWGHSFVCGPFGQMLAEGGENNEIVVAEVDFSAKDAHRITWPFFRDRRIDSYSKLQKRWLET